MTGSTSIGMQQNVMYIGQFGQLLQTLQLFQQDGGLDKYHGLVNFLSLYIIFLSRLSIYIFGTFYVDF